MYIRGQRRKGNRRKDRRNKNERMRERKGEKFLTCLVEHQISLFSILNILEILFFDCNY